MVVSDIQQRTLERLGENPATPVFYTLQDVLDAANLGQRIFAFLTLCLEAQAPFTLTPGNQWAALQLASPALIVVLRVTWQAPPANGGGGDAGWNDPIFGGPIFNDPGLIPGFIAPATPKLEPGTLHQFAAQNNGWYGTAGRPAHYQVLGFGLIVFDLNPDLQYTALVTYARMPVALVLPTDEPEIPEPDHQALVDFCVAYLRIREGGQELANEAPSMQSFMTAVSRRAAQVRTRSLAQRYDHAPPETEMPDLSRMLKTRPDLIPARREAVWTR